MRWLGLGGVKGNPQTIDSNCHVQQGDTLDMTIRGKKLGRRRLDMWLQDDLERY